MEVEVTPIATQLVDGEYIIVLRGTAHLLPGVKSWVRQAPILAWMSSTPPVGGDIVIEVDQDDPEAPGGTFFEVAICGVGSSGPGDGPSLWGGRFRVRVAAAGRPMLTAAE